MKLFPVERNFNYEYMQMKNGRYELRSGAIVDGGKLFFGCVEWYKDGKLHREDGPAVEWEDGSKEWLIEGKLHRLDGPAMEDVDGYKAWFVNGKAHRVDGPAVIDAEGNEEWLQNGKFHRLDGPAIVRKDGFKAWYFGGVKVSHEQHTAMTRAITKESITSFTLKRRA